MWFGMEIPEMAHLMSLWNISAVIKAVGFSTIVVVLIRYYAYLLKSNFEAKTETNGNLASEKVTEEVIADTSPRYPIPECKICDLPLFNESGLEFTRNSVVQLSCHHLLHRQCYLNLQSNSKTKPQDTLPSCPTCFTDQITLSEEPLHMWQTVAYWSWHINEALDRFGPSNFLSWANVRLRAKEIANLSVDILKAGDLHSFDSQDCREEEDLIGPGAFPIRKAMLSAGAMRYECNGKQYSTLGDWITHKSSEGTEREIWKVSWGSPSWALCCNCGGRVPLCSQLKCHRCHGISSEVSYWCSEECQENDNLRHRQICEILCGAWNDFQAALAKRKEEHEKLIRDKYSNRGSGSQGEGEVK
jgi:hypothetical protein